MRTIILALAAILPLASQVENTSAVYATAKRPRAIAVIGDRYHSPVFMRDGLAATLIRENIPVTFIEDVTVLNKAALADFQLLIMARNGRYWPDGTSKPFQMWMTDEQAKTVTEFVENGGGLLALHNGHTYFPAAWAALVGGAFGGHPKPYTFTVRVENKNHPITAGMEDFDIFDEQHMSKFTLSPDHLLLRSISRDNVEASAGWWNEVGKGRICYLSPGHTPESLNHPMVQRLIRNAARWLTRDGELAGK
jgi:type 1 glutamine amidotransferase